MAPFWEDDLDAMLDPDDFGESVLIDGAPVDIQWLEPFEAVSVFGLDVDNAAPVVLVKASAVPALSSGSVIVRGGVSYYPQSIQPDGTGMLTVLVSRN